MTRAPRTPTMPAGEVQFERMARPRLALVQHLTGLEASFRGLGIPVTLSCFGVCGSETTARPSILAGADLALHRSQELGRDRTEIRVGTVPDDPPAQGVVAAGAGL